MLIPKAYDHFRAAFINMLIVVVTLLGSAYFFWADANAAKSSLRISDTSFSQNDTKLVRIDSIRVGTRVWADNPEGRFDHTLGDAVDPLNWKHLSLDYPTLGGSSASIELLRPDWWLRECNATRGSTIYVSIPECGIEGDAFVLDIKPCPSIPSGPGSVVTGKIRHRAQTTVEVELEGSDDAIECTGNHPIWSEDRHKFVSAESLIPGERLRCVDAKNNLTVVKQVTSRQNASFVYNIEVHGGHVYYVGKLGVLVHNDCYRYANSTLRRRGRGDVMEMVPGFNPRTNSEVNGVGHLPNYPVSGRDGMGSERYAFEHAFHLEDGILRDPGNKSGIKYEEWLERFAELNNHSVGDVLDGSAGVIIRPLVPRER